jgi:hypothetical protein
VGHAAGLACGWEDGDAAAAGVLLCCGCGCWCGYWWLGWLLVLVQSYGLAPDLGTAIELASIFILSLSMR